MTEVSRSSVTRQRPAWMRVLLPSVGDLIFVAILGMLLCTPLSVKLLGDGGIGWHIRTGQMIVATHAIPHVDSFSSTMSGRPWFAWEWLYDVTVGELERVAGLNGVVWLTALAIAAIFSLAFRLLVRRGVGVLLALALVLLAASASMVHFLARPHVISWLFSLLWFWILDRTELDTFGVGAERRKSQRLLWFLPLLMLVWVNVHGGFLVGFALLGIYLASAAYAWATLRETRWEDALVKLWAGRRSKQLFLVGSFTLLATYFNPYGWRLYAHIYQYLSNRFLIDHIDEFQSPNFHGAAERCFAVLMLIALVALAARGRRLRLSEGLVVLFAVYSGLYAVRNVPVSSLLLILVAGPLLAESMQRFRGRAVFAFLQRMTAVELDLRGHHLWPVVTIVAAFSVAANGGNVGSKRLMDAHFGSPRFPVEAVNHLEQGKSWGPILAPDYWGGYLIYRLYPEVRVVVDDRHDFYGEDFLRDYVTTIHAERGWEKFLLEHNVCCVLAAKGSALDNILAQSGDWTEIYRDDVAVAFEKSH